MRARPRPGENPSTEETGATSTSLQVKNIADTTQALDTANPNAETEKAQKHVEYQGLNTGGIAKVGDGYEFVGKDENGQDTRTPMTVSTHVDPELEAAQRTFFKDMSTGIDVALLRSCSRR